MNVHSASPDRGEGPREKLLQRGAQALSDTELLAVLLRTGCRGSSALDLARELLDERRGLAGVASAAVEARIRKRGVGPGKLSLLLAALEFSRRCAEQPLRRGSVMSSPRETRRFLQRHLAPRAREVFCCLFLDSQHRLICCEDLFTGTLDGAAVYPREVLARALHHQAAALILAHNHPSGVAVPSEADRRITRRLCEALKLIDLRVLDHLIVARGECFSFAESGLL